MNREERTMNNEQKGVKSSKFKVLCSKFKVQLEVEMIGIFDSGVGGLTVVGEIFKKLPEYQVVYFGDTARVPYGTKSKETITRYALGNTHFLIKNKASIIIVACNTASALALDSLQKNLIFQL
jgi:glutamate racemase